MKEMETIDNKNKKSKQKRQQYRNDDVSNGAVDE
jgi:hypothetical protein